MGQIFNRIKNITNSYINDRDIDVEYILNKDEDDLKKIIDELESEQKQKQKSNTNYKSSTSNKNHYEVIGVKSTSSKEEIYSAYKNLLKQYHPDKVASLGEEIQNVARNKTQEINSAFQKIKEERKW